MDRHFPQSSEQRAARLAFGWAGAAMIHTFWSVSGNSAYQGARSHAGASACTSLSLPPQTPRRALTSFPSFQAPLRSAQARLIHNDDSQVLPLSAAKV
jgi:hypothetical protein